DQLVCVLSDGRTLAVPISISPILRDAPIEARYNWRLAGGGEAVVWRSGKLEEKLTLSGMLGYPESTITSE
ncbi:MAG: DUF2442 domain-containing protein, partial [Gemmatimonadales bacterium]